MFRLVQHGTAAGGLVRGSSKRSEEIVIPFVKDRMPRLRMGWRAVGGDSIGVDLGDGETVSEDLTMRDQPHSPAILEEMANPPAEWVWLALPLVLASDRVDAMTKLRLAARLAEAKGER